MNYQRIILVGNATRDAERRTSQNGEVTYTVVLSNSGAADANGTLMTDTLPSEVDFARWLEQPAGATESGDEITWTGTVTASEAITFTFVATHTGDYSEVVTNTADESGSCSI